MIVRGVDYIDLRSGFIRVDRVKAEEILPTWLLFGDLTAHEVAEILARYDTVG